MDSSGLSGHDRFEEEDSEGNKKDEEEAQQVSLAIGHVSQFAREKQQKCTTEKAIAATLSKSQMNGMRVMWKKFLGGLSLHLNHLIGSRVRNYDWPFGTLPFGLFGSNLDTMDLETYPRTYSGQF